MAEAAKQVGSARFSAAGGSDPGRVRAGNEDRLHLDADRGIFAVVDGVGGHAAGEVAAAIAVEVIAQRLERPLWSPEQRVREAIALANNEILRQSQARPEHAGMTCVLTLALLTGNRLTVGHVGDTRLYRLTPAGMVKLTHDHSPIGEREDSREISEAEAMRHPRRNEVFRDVGSAFHEPEDADFVEVIETPFDERTAVLLCSDGLSDMVPSAAIERSVRQHAGNPAHVVEALIQAANDAGGRDNVTVVYVEGALFSVGPGAAWFGSDAATGTSGAPERRDGAIRRFFRNRATWLVAGMLTGIAAGLSTAWMLPFEPALTPTTSRTLIVGGDAPEGFPSIAAALASAKPRDVVQVEPGEYSEALVLPDGVNLTARRPGTVVLVAPPGREGWVSLSASGSLGNRIDGISVLGRTDAPIAAGVRLAGHDIQVSDVTVQGTVALGFDISGDGEIVVRGSRLTDISGLPLRIGPKARPVIRQTHFVRAGAESRSPAVEIAPDATPEVTGNVFVGYKEIADVPRPGREQLSSDNHVIQAPEGQAPRRSLP
jgi:serine/threonine protein phosphatase PrpC